VGEGHILETGRDVLGHATLALAKYGKAAVDAKLKKAQELGEQLRLISGGTKDGSYWAQGLSPDADKDTILAEFDKCLKDMNEDDAAETLINSVVEAFKRVQYLCISMVDDAACDGAIMQVRPCVQRECLNT
jgi:hypothetical protein